MRIPTPIIVLASLAGLGLGALLSWHTLHRPDVPSDVLPPRVDSALVAEQARAVVLDSVIAVQRARDDSARVEQAARELRVAVLIREAAQWERAANQAADSARALGDTLGLAWTAAEASRARGDSLTVALVVADSARQVAEQRAMQWRLVADTLDRQRRALLRLNAELREAVDRATTRGSCRIAGAIPCPSRTLVAAAGMAVGAVGVLYLDR